MLIFLAVVGGIILYLLGSYVFRLVSLRSITNETKNVVEDESVPRLDEKKRVEDVAEFPDIEAKARPQGEELEQMKRDKELYYKLQNLEDYPAPLSLDAVEEAETRLVSLLDLTMHDAKAAPTDTILSIPSYDSTAIRDFLDAAHQATMSKYQAYVSRRRAHGPRELFKDATYAKRWLQLAALVKYVDGGWIGAIINGLPTTARKPSDKDTSLERTCGKIAWQVISEEFGDGDLTKNHVYLYEKLVSSLNLGTHTSSTSHLGYNENFDGTAQEEGIPNCWSAAIAQQCIGLMAAPEDYYAEALGFNMAYEALPYHLLVTSYELRELKIDDYYFNIHITIDNPSTGHSAMARIAVEKYIEGIEKRDGTAAAEKAWKRVQAGFILAEGLPTTPTKPRAAPCTPIAQVTPLSVSQPTAAFASLILNKAASSNKIHCASRLRLGGKTVDEWLDTTKEPITFQRAVKFATVLSDKQGWVVHGNPKESRLVKELEWGGRMFGAFSRPEVEIVRSWIRSMGKAAQDISGSYAQHIASEDLSSPSTPPPPYSKLTEVDMTTPLLPVLSLWFLSLTLLDKFQLSPSKFASPLGMIVLRIQRAQLGFISLHRPEDICEGSDESQLLGFENGLWEIASKIWTKTTGTPARRDIRSMPGLENLSIETIDSMLAFRSKPYASSCVLLGLVEGFSSLRSCEFITDQLDVRDKESMGRMMRDESEAIQEWKETAGEVDLVQFEKGKRIAMDLVVGVASSA